VIIISSTAAMLGVAKYCCAGSEEKGGE
jgi:hypothetical protein